MNFLGKKASHGKTFEDFQVKKASPRKIFLAPPISKSYLPPCIFHQGSHTDYCSIYNLHYTILHHIPEDSLDRMLLHDFHNSLFELEKNTSIVKSMTNIGKYILNIGTICRFLKLILMGYVRRLHRTFEQDIWAGQNLSQHKFEQPHFWASQIWTKPSWSRPIVEPAKYKCQDLFLSQA